MKKHEIGQLLRLFPSAENREKINTTIKKWQERIAEEAEQYNIKSERCSWFDRLFGEYNKLINKATTLRTLAEKEIDINSYSSLKDFLDVLRLSDKAGDCYYNIDKGLVLYYELKNMDHTATISLTDMQYRGFSSAARYLHRLID